jgi:cold shock CspA family protein
MPECAGSHDRPPAEQTSIATAPAPYSCAIACALSNWGLSCVLCHDVVFFACVAGAGAAALCPAATREAPLSKPLPSEPALGGGWQRATVKWFNRVRGFGFVSRGEGTEDIYVDIDAVRASNVRELTPGQELHVRFARIGRFLRATQVRLA